jgi:hypothetical protein
MFTAYASDGQDDGTLRTLDDQTPADLAGVLGRPVVVASYMREVWAAIQKGR